MTEMNSELLNRLVTGRKQDGRRTYDPQAKRELVRECLKPGVSVARMAMQHGINANLLRLWIAKSQGQGANDTRRALAPELLESSPAFIAVQIKDAGALVTATPPARAPLLQGKPAPSALIGLHARLPNGVTLEFDHTPADALLPVMQLLSTLPCSS
jgi:transposase